MLIALERRGVVGYDRVVVSDKTQDAKKERTVGIEETRVSRRHKS
jgi:hypothetical protein